ncbi:hypothetical protein [Mesorhizobium sp. ISC15]|uniref:hypothetical protein n=1 Tax=Mesorhizobium sp. ISC15 TaxID=3076429 RepID=UPI00301C891D
MADDKLKVMLENAQLDKANADAAKADEAASELAAINAAAAELRERLMPRLNAAKQAWKDSIILNIEDGTTGDFSERASYPTLRRVPQIRVWMSTGSVQAG